VENQRETTLLQLEGLRAVLEGQQAGWAVREFEQY